MSIFYLKLHNKSDNVLLQSILGCYDHIMWVRTEVPSEMIVKVITTPDLVQETREILEELRKEIDYDFV